MPASRLTRRASLLLPFLLAACGHDERQAFPPLRYGYLPPIRLSVGSIDVQQRFSPSGRVAELSDRDPVHPMDALRAMAEDRLQALGSGGQAVFAITNASLLREDDRITCALAVVLEIYPSPGIRAGFAQAVVSRQFTGPIDDFRGALYDITKESMDAMNVEFEYQVRRNLGPWLVAAAPSPVEQQPLDTSPIEPSGGTPLQGPPGQGQAPLQGPPGQPPMPGPPGQPLMQGAPGQPAMQGPAEAPGMLPQQLGLPPQQLGAPPMAPQPQWMGPMSPSQDVPPMR